MKQKSKYAVIMLMLEREEDAAKKQLSQAFQLLQQQQQKLAELEAYRSSYFQKLVESGQAGINAREHEDYRAFLNNLEHSVGSQQKILATSKQAVNQCKQRFWQCQQRKNNIQYLEDKAHLAQQIKQDKEEQKQSDEWAIQKITFKSRR